MRPSLTISGSPPWRLATKQQPAAAASSAAFGSGSGRVDQPHAHVEPELAHQPAQRPLVLLLPRPGVAGDDDPGVGDPGDRSQEHVLTLPGGDSSEDDADEPVRRGRGRRARQPWGAGTAAARGAPVGVGQTIPTWLPGEAVVEHACARLAGRELRAHGLRDARQRGRGQQQAAVGRPGRLGVDLAHVPDVGDARPAGRQRAREGDRRVRVDERDVGRQPTGQPAGHPREAGRRQLGPAQDRQRLDPRLDALGAQLADQRAVGREHDEGGVALGVESAGDQRQLAVGAVTAGRGVDEEDPPAQRATSRAAAGPGGARSG